MKQIIFPILFATLFVACDKNPEISPDLTQIRIKERPCDTVELCRLSQIAVLLL